MTPSPPPPSDAGDTWEGDPSEGRAPTGTAASAGLLPDRYADLGRIGGGAFGEVRRVHDRRLDCTFAMKILRVEVAGDAEARRRFEGEARVTARLRHPGVVAVQDVGVLPDGRAWYTMEEVEGRTLSAMFARLGAEDGWTLRRAVDALQRACEAVAYAHSRGVVHRDLKPDNVMVGAFGEVRVMDWGLARAPWSVGPGDEDGAEAPVASARASATLVGRVMGSPGYMAPEQARGERAGPGADVYALGAMLYLALTGRPPHEGGGRQALLGVLSGPPPSVETASAGRAPSELVRICEHAMERDPRQRYPDASGLAAALAAWLDGARRREEALELVAAARLLLPRIHRLRASVATLDAAASGAMAGVAPWAPVAEKRASWALEAQRDEARRELRLAEVELVQGLRAALTRDPTLTEADELLADHYRSAAESAEESGDPLGLAEAEVLLRAHDRGRHAAWLTGVGALSLVTDPPGAFASLARFVERDRRWVAERVHDLGPTPLREVAVPHGSYLVRLRLPGHADVAYPVRVGRGEHWDGVPPGATAPLPVRLPRVGDDLGTGDEADCYIPAGPTWVGGDPDAPDGLPARRWWVDGFFLQRNPVTNGAYIRFLDDLVARGDEAAALRHAPTEDFDGRGACLYARTSDGRFLPTTDRLGRVWAPDSPVVLVSSEGATAYAAWLADREKRPWRLPHDVEWEKAGRGADRRLQPWGRHLDPTWANVSTSHAGPPRWTPVSAFPLDESPYGVRGLAGNVRDWCANGYRRLGPEPALTRLDPIDPDPGELRMIRGGAWGSTPRVCRLAGRFASRPWERVALVGFRLARSWG